MQLKFISLSLSAVLALSAISANALPSGEAGAEVAVAPVVDAQAIEPQVQNTDLQAVNREVIINGLIHVVTALLNRIIDPLLREVVQTVVGLLNIITHPFNHAGDQQEAAHQLYLEIQNLVALPIGALTDSQAPVEAAAIPQDSNPMTVISNFLINLMAGHDSVAAANGDVTNVLTAVQGLADIELA